MEESTGRVFQCLSRLGAKTRLMKEYFNVGCKYLEAKEDFLGNNNCSDESLLLYSEYKTTDGYSMPMYVDMLDFEFVAIRNVINLN